MYHLKRAFLLLAFFVASVAAVSNESRFRLQLLHFADADGNDLDALENIYNLSALVADFRADFPDRTILLSSGDNYVPGLRYHAASNDSMRDILGVPGAGRGDIALLNALGLTASTVGNHELDAGPAAFAHAIRPEYDDNSGAVYSGAAFPYLGANIKFTTDPGTADLVTPDRQNVSSIPGRLAGSAFVVVGDEKVGLVGGVTPDFSNITETGSLAILPEGFNAEERRSLDLLAAELQEAVNGLMATGINKIVMITHMQQLAIDQELATRLAGVDILVAGGSNTLLADADDRLRPGDVAAALYPLIFESPIGEPVLLVNTPGDYRYLGRLVVDFDADGRIVGPFSGDDSYSGAYATDDIDIRVGGGTVPQVTAIADALSEAVKGATDESAVFGYSTVLLEGRRAAVRTEETNLGNLVADANLELARTVDSSALISLVSGGGIRTKIDPGGISQLSLANALSFNSELVLLTVTAAELLSIVEHGVASSERGATPGAFPQVSGLRLVFDSAKPGIRWLDVLNCSGEQTFGSVSRVRDLNVVDQDTGESLDRVVENGALVGDPERTFRLVTVAYLANGGDGYPYPCLSSPRRVDLGDVILADGNAPFADAGSEQDALAEYLLNHFFVTPFGVADTPATQDDRIVPSRVPSRVR